jgi:protein-disulfide isomerase
MALVAAHDPYGQQHPQPGYGQPGQPGQPRPPGQPAQPGQPGYPPGYQPPGYPPEYQPPAAYPPAYPQQAAYPPAVQQGYPTPGYPPAGYPPSGYPPAGPPRSNQRTQILVVAGVAIVAMVAVLGFAVFFINRSGDDGSGPGPTTARSADSGASGGASAPAEADPATGLRAGSGPVRVEVYVDYQCPPCSTFEQATGDALQDYVSANRITLSVHPVAFIDNRSRNKYSTRAAAAVACAYDAGKLLEFHAHLLENQPLEDTEGPTDREFVAWGATMGLGTGFEECVIGQRKLGWVRQATSAAQAHGVASVPAAYVNDQKVGTTESDLVTAITGAR